MNQENVIHQCGYIKVHFTYPIHLMYWVMVFKGIFFASPLTSHYTSFKDNYISHKTYCTLLHIVNISMVVAERGERTSDCLVVSILNCIVGILATYSLLRPETTLMKVRL